MLFLLMDLRFNITGDLDDEGTAFFNMLDQVEALEPSPETFAGNKKDSSEEQMEVPIEPLNSEFTHLSFENTSDLEDEGTTLVDKLDEVERLISVLQQENEFEESLETFTGIDSPKAQIEVPNMLDQVEALEPSLETFAGNKKDSEEEIEVPIEPPNSEVADINDVGASTSSESKVMDLRGGGKRKTSKRSSKGKSFEKVKVQSDEDKFDEEAAPKAKKKSNVDIFGNEITTSYLNTFKTKCPHCKKIVQAKGFARHLESCMGINNRSGRRARSNKG